MPNYNSKSGHGWMSIRISGDGKEIEKLAAAVVRKPEEIMVKYYFQQVQRIVFEARRLMLEIITRAETETGKLRAARGGNGPGRIKTKKMIDAVWARAYKNGSGGVVGTVGWLNGRPGYAIFQEHGTRTGIVAMDALRQAGDYIEREMDKLGKGGFKYRRNTDWNWSEPTYGGQIKDPPDWYSR